MSEHSDLVRRLRQYEGEQWETTACYNGTRDEVADAIEAMERKVADRDEALRDLWSGTTWGAGKGAAFEAHRRVLVEAGIKDIGD